MQLDGVGGGISSTSKVAVISPSSRDDCHIEYLFGDITSKAGIVDWSGSCGNLVAAAGLFAIRERMCSNDMPDALDGRFDGDDSNIRVHIWQANLGHKLIVHVPQNPGAAEHVAIPGVPGTGPPVVIEFIRPGTSDDPDASILPTGSPSDDLHLDAEFGGGTMATTLVVGANPTIFVDEREWASRLAALNILSNSSDASSYDAQLGLINQVRTKGAILMGVELSSQVRIAWVQPVSSAENGTTETTRDAPTDSVDSVDSIDLADIQCRIMSVGRIHHAFTGTGAINTACAAAIPGTIPWQCMGRRLRGGGGVSVDNSSSSAISGGSVEKVDINKVDIRLAHPSGVMRVQATVQATVQAQVYKSGASKSPSAAPLPAGVPGTVTTVAAQGPDGGDTMAARRWVCESAGLVRTARVLMVGEVFLE
jgi:2-methylaconitate cis-trans-isomerase PrpF